MEYAGMDGFSEWQNDARTVAVNREPHRASFFHYSTPQAAWEGRPLPSDRYLLLHGTWKFRRFASYRKRPISFAQPDFPARGWETVEVPVARLEKVGVPQEGPEQYPWEPEEEIQPPFAPAASNPVGCYIRRFRLPEGWEDDRLILCFEGVRSAFYLYINGERAGYAEGSGQHAEFDVTALVRPGLNTLAVEVYFWSTGSWLEHPAQGASGGIERDVYLYRTPKQAITDLSVSAQPDAELRDGLLTVRACVCAPAEGTRIEMTVYDATGHMTAYDSRFLPASGVAELRATVAGVRLWSDESPTLYRVVLTLTGDDGVLEATAVDVGFRRIELRGGVLLCNGKRLVLLGAVRREPAFRADTWASPEEMEREIPLLKRNHINAVCLVDGPAHPAFYALCDRYGLYVVDSTNIDATATGEGVPGCAALPGSQEAWTPACLDRAAALYERDKNHPCVILWSLGGICEPGGNLSRMAAECRRRDPYRPVCCLTGNAGMPDSCCDVLLLSRIQPGQLAQTLRQGEGRPVLLCDPAKEAGGPAHDLSGSQGLSENPQLQGAFFSAWGKPVVSEHSKRELLPGRALRQRVSFRAVDAARGKVELTNRFLFTNLNRYLIRWAQTKCGETLRGGELRLSAAPGETVLLDLELNRICSGEWTLELAVVQEEKSLWAEADEPVAEAQFVVQAHLPLRAFPHGSETPRIVSTYGAVSVETGLLRIRVSRRTGWLDSIRFRGEELLRAPVQPSFWRPAVTPEQALAGAVWREAEEQVRARVISVQPLEGAVCIRTACSLPSVSQFLLELTYTVAENGVLVESHLEAPRGLPPIPEACLRLPLIDAFSSLSYYGYGVLEELFDAQAVAPLGVYQVELGQPSAPARDAIKTGLHPGLRWGTLRAPRMELRLEAYPALGWRACREGSGKDARLALRLEAAREDGSEDVSSACLRFGLFVQDARTAARDE